MSAVDQGAPSPGCWELDADHHERPMPPFFAEIFPQVYTEGFRAACSRYGFPIETVECAIIDDFVYMAVRPVGAPPEAKGNPPDFVMKILSRVHPEMRRRNKASLEAFRTKSWRAEREQYVREVHPDTVRRCDELLAVDLKALSDAELSGHLRACREMLVLVFSAHFQVTGAHMLPVGDYLARVGGWTGAKPSELLAALRGSSVASRGAEPELVRAASALNESGVEVDVSATDPRSVLDAWAARKDEVGGAVSAWLHKALVSTVSGHSLVDVTGREVPDVLLRTLGEAVKSQRPECQGQATAEEAARALRERVPEEYREEFDEVLAEARAAYGLRDLRSEGVGCGISKQALLEAGRRLEQRRSLTAAEHALSLTLEQIVGLLSGGASPSSVEAASLHERFTGRTVKDVPAFIGPRPAEPPSAELFPAGLRRTTAALNAYLASMWAGEKAESDRQCGAEGSATKIQGHGASQGKNRGTAKIIRTPADFSRLQKGDILIAPITTPHYNVVLPLLGGVVTDRGGILSHPAIVAREFGIPGVVGTKVATAMIPDGALVEVDGAEGTVTVLS